MEPARFNSNVMAFYYAIFSESNPTLSAAGRKSLQPTSKVKVVDISGEP